MTVDQLLIAGLLLLATLQRLIELVIANRNTRALLAEGAYEVGRGHYPAIVFLHTAWLAVLWAFFLLGLTLFQPWAAIAYLLVQVLRVWTLVSLGRYWTARIIVVPNAPLVRKGPYRSMRHPNYPSSWRLHCCRWRSMLAAGARLLDRQRDRAGVAHPRGEHDVSR